MFGLVSVSARVLLVRRAGRVGSRPRATLESMHMLLSLALGLSEVGQPSSSAGGVIA